MKNLILLSIIAIFSVIQLAHAREGADKIDCFSPGFPGQQMVVIPYYVHSGITGGSYLSMMSVAVVKDSNKLTNVMNFNNLKKGIVDGYRVPVSMEGNSSKTLNFIGNYDTYNHMHAYGSAFIITDPVSGNKMTVTCDERVFANGDI